MDLEARNVCMREAQILQRIQHDNIIAIFDIFVASGSLYMIFEYADMGDMTHLIADMKAKGLRLPEVQIWQLVYCIALGLDHLHSQNIMHRDIKPANIYISRSGDVKVGDLGLGRELASASDKAGSLVGTPYYMSPEIINEEPYSFKTDIWSLGCLVYEITTLRVPFQGEDLFSLGQRIRYCQFAPLDGPYSLQLKDFIQTLLQRQPERRLSANEISRLAFNMIQQNRVVSPSMSQPSQPQSPSSMDSSPNGSFDENNPFKDLEDLGIIGRGQYSVVHKARRRTDGSFVAVKRVQSFVAMEQGDTYSSTSQAAMNEARLLQTLHHPHIIKYHSAHLITGDLYLILELANGGDLGSVISQAIQSGHSLNEAQIWRYFVQVPQRCHSCTSSGSCIAISSPATFSSPRS